MNLFNKIRNIIKRAVVTRAADDSRNFVVQQVFYNGTVSDCEIVYPYGMSANLPNNSSLLMFNVMAQEENRAAIGGLPTERIKNLPQGEVVFFHPLTKSKIHFKNSGDIDIETVNSDLNIKVNGFATINVDGNINVTATEASLVTTGRTNVTASQVNVDSPSINLGIGGAPIARSGDPVEVVVTGGSSAGTYSGTITGGGANTSL